MDRTQAKYHSEAAAEKGGAKGMTDWGRGLFSGYGVNVDPRQFLDLLLKAAAMGQTYAMNGIAAIYTEGRDGVPAEDWHPVDIHKVGVLREVAGKLDHIPVNTCAHSARDHRVTGRRVSIGWYCCHLMPLSLPTEGKPGKPAHGPLRRPPKQINLRDAPEAS